MQLYQICQQNISSSVWLKGMLTYHTHPSGTHVLEIANTELRRRDHYSLRVVDVFPGAYPPHCLGQTGANGIVACTQTKLCAFCPNGSKLRDNAIKGAFSDIAYLWLSHE